MTRRTQRHPLRAFLSPLTMAGALLAGLAGSLACSGPAVETPVAEQSGALLYETQRCALCHGADGSSAFWRPGPDLLPHLDYWTVDSLADYLADPAAAAMEIDRLDGEDMPGYPHLDEASLRRLATYVLSLGAKPGP
jgi:mono/diheme cytochrome c family protein